MKNVVKVLGLVSALALSACTANSYCDGAQNYEKAKTVPPLQGVQGLKLPESATALKIPPAPANAVAYGTHVKDKDGDDVIQCLDKPPDMPPVPVVPPKVEEKKPA